MVVYIFGILCVKHFSMFVLSVPFLQLHFNEMLYLKDKDFYFEANELKGIDMLEIEHE